MYALKITSMCFRIASRSAERSTSAANIEAEAKSEMRTIVIWRMIISSESLLSLVCQKTVRVWIPFIGFIVLGVDEVPLADVVELGEERVPFRLGVHAREVHPVGAMDGLVEDL